MSSKVEENMNQSLDPPSLMKSLPEEILMHCIARVPRSYYPILSLVSKKFRSLVASPELYKTRFRLGFHEHCLYVAISKNQTSNVHWYILGRKPNNKHWLVPITSLPPMPLHGSSVVVGSSIYILGGYRNWNVITHSVSRIDCVSHSVQPLTDMPKAVAGSVSEHIDGKIYVIGGSDTQSPEEKSSSRAIMKFDTEAQTWKVRYSPMPDSVVGQKLLSSVEMAGKIYMRSYSNSYVYDPKKYLWTMDQILHSKEWSNSCVVNNVMYYYDVRRNCLRAFDFNKRNWEIVKGVELGKFEDGSWACTDNYDGKLAVFLQKVVAMAETTEIWYAEIAVERREDGELWGNVQWYDIVLDGTSSIMKCLCVRI